MSLLAAPVRLPTGATLDPAAPAIQLGNFPLSAVAAPDGRVVVLLCGWRETGIQVVDPKTGKVVQTVHQPGAFIGLRFAPDGKTLWASGGGEDLIYRYSWNEGTVIPDGSISIQEKGSTRVKRDPAGIAVSDDGKFLYVAENLTDTLAVIDVARGAVVQRLETDRYPYAVEIGSDGRVWVSCWGDDTVISFAPVRRGLLRRTARVIVGRHPAAMLMDEVGKRLYVASPSTDTIAVVDIEAGRAIASLDDAATSGPSEGVTPDAMALSADGQTLYVAEADANAVAVFRLSSATSGRPGKVTTDSIAGRIPVDWYPAALVRSGDALHVVSAKGRGTSPNPSLPEPPKSTPRRSTDYTLGQLDGTFLTLPVEFDPAQLQTWTRRVARANRWDQPRVEPAWPPFHHVIYVIKENRTYDQIFGDVREGDGDPSLLFFGRDVTPNHHALAARFGLFDRFFVNAEVSADGHNWSTAAYVTDYVTKTVPAVYSNRRHDYDYEGTNRGVIVDDDDDVAAPAAGYLWDTAVRKGLSIRNYGEFIDFHDAGEEKPSNPTRRALVGNTDPTFPGFDLTIPDQKRADVWIRDLHTFVKEGEMPALQIIRLPNDHTAGGKKGAPTPRAYVADNDLALGRIIAALSRTPFWKDTAVFVLEDDAQNGPDHVDSHRSCLLVVSAWNRPGSVHRFTNTTDVLATIEGILGLDPLSQFDFHAKPLHDIFAAKPDLEPYDALIPKVDLEEKNPSGTPAAKASERLDLRRDAADEDAFNRILWSMLKGNEPYPGVRRMPGEPAWRER